MFVFSYFKTPHSFTQAPVVPVSKNPKARLQERQSVPLFPQVTHPTQDLHYYEIVSSYLPAGQSKRHVFPSK